MNTKRMLGEKDQFQFIIRSGIVTLHHHRLSQQQNHISIVSYNILDVLTSQLRFIKVIP